MLCVQLLLNGILEYKAKNNLTKGHTKNTHISKIRINTHTHTHHQCLCETDLHDVLDHWSPARQLVGLLTHSLLTVQLLPSAQSGLQVDRHRKGNRDRGQEHIDMEEIQVEELEDYNNARKTFS